MPCIQQITCSLFSHQQIFNKAMYAYFLEPQFTDKYHTFHSPRNCTVVTEFNNLTFLMEDLNKNIREENIKYCANTFSSCSLYSTVWNTRKCTILHAQAFPFPAKLDLDNSQILNLVPATDSLT